jgi:hypothetical protein
MLPAIAGVVHNASGRTFRVNGYGQCELITPLRLRFCSSPPVGGGTATRQVERQQPLPLQQGTRRRRSGPTSGPVASLGFRWKKLISWNHRFVVTNRDRPSTSQDKTTSCVLNFKSSSPLAIS